MDMARSNFLCYEMYFCIVCYDVLPDCQIIYNRKFKIINKDNV